MHDFLNKTSGSGEWYGKVYIERPRYSREEAEGVLTDAITVLKVSLQRKDVIWAAVRVGGHNGWGH